MASRVNTEAGGTVRRMRSRAVLGVALAAIVTLAGCMTLAVPGAPFEAEGGEYLTFTVDVAVECASVENVRMVEPLPPVVTIGGIRAEFVEMVPVTDAEPTPCSDGFEQESRYSSNGTVALTVVAPNHTPGTYDLTVTLYGTTEPLYYLAEEERGDEQVVELATVTVPDAVVYADDGDGDVVPEYVDTRDTRRVTNGYADADRTTMMFKVGIMRGYLSLNGDGFGGSEITIDTLERLPPRMPAPDGEVVAAIDVDLPRAKHVADRSLTVRMPVLMNAGDDYDVDALHVAYYDTATGEWKVVETTVVDRTVGGGYDVVHLEGEIPYPTTIAVVHQPADDGGD